MDWLKNIIDASLKEMSAKKLMMSPGDIFPEMLDDSIQAVDDWKGWRPIKSIITDEDINELEEKIARKLPQSYREYLKYKHFYKISIPDFAINLPAHLPDRSLDKLRELVFECMDPEYLIGRNYIYFADFHDYGLLCFDANESVDDNEYKIVFIDHEDYDSIHFYANNFRELLEADSERGNNFIEKLNNYYS